MPTSANPEMLFLFEDEVRVAARQLAKLRALRSAPAGDEDAIGNAMVDALNACMAALAGAECDDACLLLARKPDLGLTPNDRSNPAAEGGPVD